MKRIPLVIKTGSTLPELAARRGDFEDWILAGLGLARAAVAIVDVTAGEALPPVERVAGAVITGSHAMVTDHAPWSERVADWLCGARGAGVPVLGICYGHQLLAYALGGEVANNPRGLEFGTVTATVLETAADDPLLGGLGGTLRVQASHTQSVLRLPPGATLLATSALDPHFAFVVDGILWGVQFHPEFDAEVVTTYIQAHAADLAEVGVDPVALLAACEATPVGTTILRRFAAVMAKAAGYGEAARCGEAVRCGNSAGGGAR